jgi:7,8-dihydropterin-6-yl-methyl-4-(beta-D-ribofuranosyl)aminobenzene 5'-phosphate synthase
MNKDKKFTAVSGVQNLAVTIVYDNNPYKEGLQTGWGFSCLITGAEKTILFDTGPGSGLLANMERLQIDPAGIDTVFLSHIHPDHTGGLDSFLTKNHRVTIYQPKGFPKKFKDKMQAQGTKIVEVEGPLKICEDVYSTGQIGKWIREQALVVRTNKGLIVVTGCSHPGIINIVNKARNLVKENILFVMGGFHLEWTTTSKIEKIITAFKELGVRYVGVCHCSGNKARNLFEKHFGKNYINIGAGKVIDVKDLQ